MLLRRSRSRPDSETALHGQDIAGLLPNTPTTSTAPPLTPRELRRARMLEDPQAAMRIAPPRGWPGEMAGRTASVPTGEVFRADTERASGLYPFLTGASLPAVGSYIGWNTLTAQSFSAHPSVWVQLGITTNPNVMITGIPGSGKSAHIKALGFRLMALGHSMLVAGDVKGEYTPLARHLGCEPVRLGPGMPGRLNPLDAGPLGVEVEETADERLAKAQRAEIHRRRLTLLQALLELHLQRPVSPTEQEALDVAVREVTGELHGQSHLSTPTLPQVHAVLKDPTPAMAEELRVRDGEIQLAREQMASLRSALGRMITGHLSGLFDEETSIALDWDAPIQSIDISALRAYGDETVAMVLTCVSSWAQSALDRPGGRPWLVVRDELWRQLRSGGAAMARKIDSDLRLSRAEGVIDVLATHRLSDLEAVGAAGSEASSIARDLISSCETRIQLHQDTRPLEITRDAIGLTDAECALIASWSGQRGRALWKVGGSGSSHAVQLMLSRTERQLFETDERMAL
jgi:type IV secretory pathway VirB4 component